MRPRTVLVEDHPAYHQALVTVLEGSGSFELVLAATRAEEVVAFTSLNPVDLVVCDMHLPTMSGAELCRELMGLSDPPKVCFISADGRRDTVMEALSAGAVGYIHKSTRPREMVTLLQAAAAGEDAFDLSTASTIAGSAVPGARGVGHPRLTLLQLDVLRGLAAGLEGEALAERVGLGAADSHAAVQAVLDQVGAANAAAAVAWALRNNVIA